MTLIGLVLEPDTGAAKNGFIRGHAIVGEPLLPPLIRWIDEVLAGEIGRLELSADPALHFGQAFRARHRSER